MKKITVIGANPAWQKTLVFSDFTINQVNRAESILEFSSGKGINFCRAAGVWQRCLPEVIQFTGGGNEKNLISGLDSEGLVHKSISTTTPTRCCITCLDQKNHTTTECIEPSYAVSEAEAEALLQTASESLASSGLLAICGTLPGSGDPALYSRLAALSSQFQVPLLLDAYKNAEAVFAAGGTVWLKINQGELAELAKEKNVKYALKKLFTQYPNLQYAAITAGAETAFCTDGKRLCEYQIPEISPIVSTLGCGDTASAVWGSEMLCRKNCFEAFRSALGAACANCLNAKCGFYDKADAIAIASRIKMVFRKLD